VKFLQLLCRVILLQPQIYQLHLQTLYVDSLIFSIDFFRHNVSFPYLNFLLSAIDNVSLTSKLNRSSYATRLTGFRFVGSNEKFFCCTFRILSYDESLWDTAKVRPTDYFLDYQRTILSLNRLYSAIKSSIN